MCKGKIIVIEGTDCSGKETQATRLVEKLKMQNIKVARISFPMYDTPTGKIIGACLLGKPQMCDELLKEEKSFFEEGGGNVDPIAAIDLYAADRRYNLPIIQKLLDEGNVVIIDRYVTSNMAHRGGLIEEKSERLKIYNKIEKLEYEINELPRPDKTILLYLPLEYAKILKQHRAEKPDEAESNEAYLRRGEAAYLELADLYNFDVIDCVKDNKIRTIDDINDELYKKIIDLISPIGLIEGNSEEKTKNIIQLQLI